MLPANQGFHAGDAAAAQVDDRLIVQHELFALERAPQAGLEHRVLERRSGRFVRVELVGVLALLLRPVHRDVGVLQQCRRVGCVVRIDADADAAGHEQLVAVHLER